MTDEHDNNPNPPTAKKAWYHIIIEATDVEDTEWQAEEVTMLTEQMGNMIDFNASVWLDDVEYETDEPNTPENP